MRNWIRVRVPSLPRAVAEEAAFLVLLIVVVAMLAVMA